MVRKLMKYDFVAYLHTLLPMEIIVLGMAILNRVVRLFEGGGLVYRIVFISSLVALIVAAVAATVMTVVVGVLRFYRNLFTAEGYLSFTLPVTPSQHIAAKLFTAVLFTVGNLLVVLAAVSVATAGDLLVELLKAAAFLLKRYFTLTGAHGGVYMLEVLVLALAAAMNLFLLFYACVAIGQTAKKNRVLAAFGVYFAYYLIQQLLGTLMIIFVSQFYHRLPIRQILLFMQNNPLAAVHWILCGLCVFCLLLNTLYYLVIRTIMQRRLNLE